MAWTDNTEGIYRRAVRRLVVSLVSVAIAVVNLVTDMDHWRYPWAHVTIGVLCIAASVAIIADCVHAARAGKRLCSIGRGA